jgi:hypothetical protein
LVLGLGLVVLVLPVSVVDGEDVVEVELGLVALLSVGLPTFGELLPLPGVVAVEPVAVEPDEGEDGLIADEELPVALSVPSEPLLGVVPVVPVEPVTPVEPLWPVAVPAVPIPLVELPLPAAPPEVPAAPPAPPAAPPPAAPPPDWANAPAAAREIEARIVAASLPIRMISVSS